MDTTPIFPNPVQALAQGKKAGTTFFVRMAALSLGYDQPLVTVAAPPTWEDVQDIVTGRRLTVLKREFSDASRHVILKDMKISRSEWEKCISQAKVWKDLPFGDPCWLEQPYVPQLRHMGEVRALIVNGLLVYIFTSLENKNFRGKWFVGSIQKVRALKMLRCAFFSFRKTNIKKLIAQTIHLPLGHRQNISFPHSQHQAFPVHSRRMTHLKDMF